MDNLSKKQQLLTGFLSVCFSVFLVMIVVYGSTTIGTNITTTGTASSTSATTTDYMYVGHDITEPAGWDFSGGDFIVSGAAYFGTKATSATAFAVGAGTINYLDMSGGDLYVQGDAEIDGTASTTSALNTQGTLHVGGNAAVEGTLTIGASGNAITQLSFGTCNIPDTTITASTTAYANCASATGVTAGDNIFVTATSSLPEQFIIQAASSSVADIINLRIYHLGYDASVTSTGGRTFFWQSMR